MQSNQHIYVRKLLYELRRADHSIVVRDRDGSISGATLLGLIFRYAHVLQGLGIKRGKLLAMFAPNRPDAIAIRYAAHLLGAATAYLSMPPTTAQRRALIEQMAPDLLVVFPESVHCIEEAGAVSFVTVGTSEIGSKGRLDLLAASASADPVEVLAEANDLGVIASSGGSTGVPKGSCRSFAAYSAMVDAPSSPDRIQLINGPLAYLSQVLVDVTLLGGGQVVFRDAYDAADTLATVERERITDLFLVEPQLFELMDHRGVDARDLSSLRSITHIGVSAPNCLRQRARKRFGPIMRHVYGASEMGVVSVLAPGEHDPSQPEVFGSAGHIQPGVEIRFRRADGRLAGPGETGTIEVSFARRGAGVSQQSPPDRAEFSAGMVPYRRSRPARPGRLPAHPGTRGGCFGSRRRQGDADRDRRSALPASIDSLCRRGQGCGSEPDHRRCNALAGCVHRRGDMPSNGHASFRCGCCGVADRHSS